MKKCIFTEPARDWNDATPLGNGRLGAMVFGSPRGERIALNEETVWYGGYRKRTNPDAKENLPKIRELIFSGRIAEAERLMDLALGSCPCELSVYQCLADLSVRFSHIGDVSDYKRTLDMENAVCKVEFSSEGTKYTREYFTSAPANVLVMRFSADKSGKISFTANLNRSVFIGKKGKVGECGVFVSGVEGDGGVSFYMQLSGYGRGGKVYAIGQNIVAEDADEVTLIFSAASSFNHDDPAAYVNETVKTALSTDYNELLDAHKNDFSSYFNRVNLKINQNSDESTIPELFERLRAGDGVPDALAEHYFDFGRYLLISSSHPGCALPANLQGIWCRDFSPSWGSKFTININTEMNYWPAESCNLSECHEPLFELIERMVEHGRDTAREMYGCEGFVAHHNTDIWGGTDPQDLYIPGSYWVMGAAWLCTHMWTHYAYTKDVDFLRRAYPVMCEAAKFFDGFMVEHDGYLVTCPSVSPENTYILPSGEHGCNTYGVTMDNQILRDLFTECIEASEILGDDDPFIDRIRYMRSKLIPTQIAENGTLIEWDKAYEEREPGHRHISHLFGLYPSHQIDKDDTPELAAAAEKTLERRLSMGGGHTGWSCAWIINLYARLGDSNKAFANFRKILTNSTLPNLFDNHPPFQIDGNFGATAAIVEMLVRPNPKLITLLPALPEDWKCGEISGVCIPGNAELSMTWENGEVTSARLFAKCDFDADFAVNGKKIKVNARAGETACII